MSPSILAEFGSTALMIVFGVGVHCDTVLKGTKYQGSGHMFAITTWAFGISVALFIFGGAVCMNPAMTLAQCMIGLVPWSLFVPYVVAQMLGGLAGAVIAWFMYADDFKASEGEIDSVAQRNIFSTNPVIENLPRDFACETLCTCVFISAILAAANRAGENVLLLAIAVGIIVWAVGMGMGGITGFAMNQARDLGPRLAYQILPIRNKADNNWRYGLIVPGIAPFVGAALAALFVQGFLGMF